VRASVPLVPWQHATVRPSAVAHSADSKHEPPNASHGAGAEGGPPDRHLCIQKASHTTPNVDGSRCPACEEMRERKRCCLAGRLPLASGAAMKAGPFILRTDEPGLVGRPHEETRQSGMAGCVAAGRHLQADFLQPWSDGIGPHGAHLTWVQKPPCFIERPMKDVLHSRSRKWSRVRTCWCCAPPSPVNSLTSGRWGGEMARMGDGTLGFVCVCSRFRESRRAPVMATSCRAEPGNLPCTA
jgi:hypothetical protein